MHLHKAIAAPFFIAIVFLMAGVPGTGCHSGHRDGQDHHGADESSHHHKQARHGDESDHKSHGKSRANRQMHRIPFDRLVGYFENPQRAKWQRPGKVIALMGDISSKTVVDLGAGSGYFSFRIAKTAKKVIALEPGKKFRAYLSKRLKKSGNKNIEIRSTPYRTTNLKKGEADVIIMVNAYHHVSDRVAYFRNLKDRFKAGGRLMIVDFRRGNLPVGPPGDGHKVFSDRVLKELRAAGYKNVREDRKTLPYQYIISAQAQ